VVRWHPRRPPNLERRSNFVEAVVVRSAAVVGVAELDWVVLPPTNGTNEVSTRRRMVVDDCEEAAAWTRVSAVAHDESVARQPSGGNGTDRMSAS
jgi:hypothetical protein